jgi:hypothetical protein
MQVGGSLAQRTVDVMASAEFSRDPQRSGEKGSYALEGAVRTVRQLRQGFRVAIDTNVHLAFRELRVSCVVMHIRVNNAVAAFACSIDTNVASR